MFELSPHLSISRFYITRKKYYVKVVEYLKQNDAVFLV